MGAGVGGVLEGLLHGVRAVSWKVVQVKPAAERRVRDGLHESGLTAYLPMEVVWRRRDGRKVRHERPLIRGYVFALIADEDQHRIHGIDGAQRFVSFNGVAATIPAKFIAAIQAAEAAGEYDETAEPEKKRFALGDRVRLTRRDAFEGLSGVISRLNGGRRITVVLATVGWPISATMDEVAEDEGGEAKEAA